MSTNTPHYSLVKPAAEDFYDISVPNGNMDKIDTAIKAVSDAQANFVPRSRTVCGKPLSADIALAPEDVGAVPDTWLSSISQSIEASRRNTLNILRLKLQQSLAASDIDAWSDLLADTTRINGPASTTYMFSGHTIGLRVLAIEQTVRGDARLFGTNSYNLVAQTFLTRGALSLDKIIVNLSRYGSPVDKLTMYIYSTTGGIPNEQLFQSTNSIEGSSLTSSGIGRMDCTFTFSNANLNANTLYAFVLSRNGPYDDNNHYEVTCAYMGDTYQSGTPYYGHPWVSFAYDLYFTMNYGSGAVVWNPVTATEPLKYVAISADQTPGSGTITWYMSDDGVNWVEIPDLDTIQEVNFDSANVYLKCVLTDDAAVHDVAWGGY